jgi:hypothetical protein
VQHSVQNPTKSNDVQVGNGNVMDQMLERVRKRKKSMGGDGSRQVNVQSRPAELSRAYAAVIQNEGVSVLELLRRFRSSTALSTMAALTQLVEEVRCGTVIAHVMNRPMHFYMLLWCTVKPHTRSDCC